MVVDCWLVTLLAVFTLGGHAVQVIWHRDDWPFSAYEMYAPLVGDHMRNPASPLPATSAATEIGVLMAVAVFDGEKRDNVTTRIMHPLTSPFDRREIVLSLTKAYRERTQFRSAAAALFELMCYRAAERSIKPPIALEIILLKWGAVPKSTSPHCTPDIVELVCRIESNDIDAVSTVGRL